MPSMEYYEDKGLLPTIQPSNLRPIDYNHKIDMDTCIYNGGICDLSKVCPEDCPRLKAKNDKQNIKDTIIKDWKGDTIMELKDSGNRREFESGAVRDMQEGKGRCDLLPACAILRLSRHYENGARKYDERNWEKGIPISVMIDSGMRHLLKYLDGQTDEDHLVAACWNLMGAMWMEEKHPELQDLPTRKGSIQNRSVDDKKAIELRDWLENRKGIVDRSSNYMIDDTLNQMSKIFGIDTPNPSQK